MTDFFNYWNGWVNRHRRRLRICIGEPKDSGGGQSGMESCIPIPRFLGDGGVVGGERRSDSIDRKR